MILIRAVGKQARQLEEDRPEKAPVEDPS